MISFNKFQAVLALTAATLVVATPLQPTFSSCLSSYTAATGSNRLNVTSVYANLVAGSRAAQLGLPGEGSDVLRVDLFGVVGSQVIGFDEDTDKLATLFTDTNVGGISVYKSTSWVCNSLFPATLPTPYVAGNSTYCPLSAGPFGINISIPLYRSYALTTLSTQVRIVDTSQAANTLACVNISFTPYNHSEWYYGLFLWLPAALIIGFWATAWGARFAAGWVVGSGVAEYGSKDQREMKGKELDKAGRRDARMRKWGTMVVSGLSGERLSVSSGLLRFVTPGLRDIVHHIQFCTVLVMLAVSWPQFAYPIAARLAWADLVWNSTIVTGNAPRVTAYPTNGTLPSDFASQLTSSQYPLYLDTNTFNPLLQLGDASPGMESFATAIGLRPQDLFGTCLAIFLVIAAAVVLVSIVMWTAHATAETLTPERKRPTSVAIKRQSYGTGSSPGTSIIGDKLYDSKSAPPTPGIPTIGEHDQLPITNSQGATGGRKRTTRFRRAWHRFRPRGEAGAFHAAALYGNLLRLILIFHLPITIFSTYQLTLGSTASIVSRVFAALALIGISILIPAGVMWKVYKTPSGKLYDATRTLLAMGTMYNHYVMDKQLYRVCPLLASLITGIVVGAGQGSGIAQAVVLVVVELVMLVVPALWYPWGEGASMGAASMFLGVIRVISALLVMLLSSVFGMTDSIRTWLAYTALLLNAIAFLFFLFMLITKIVEGLIRLSGGVHFDESTHPLDGGIFAAIADLDCLNGVTGGKAAARKRRKRGSRQLQRNVSAAAGLTTQRMLDKHSLGVHRPEPGSPTYESVAGVYPSPYPRMGVADGYFPAVGVNAAGQPPLGPPPLERHSFESRTEETAHGGNIMDAWRTRSNEYAAPGTYAPSLGSPMGLYPPGSPRQSPPIIQGRGPSRSFSVVRGGRADMDHPYDVQPTSDEFGRTLSPPSGSRPMNRREYSSPVIIENAAGPVSPGGPGIYSTFPSNKRLSAGMEPVELVPLRSGGEMTLPKRRSLNDLKNEGESGTSDADSDIGAGVRRRAGEKGKKKGKRQWFARTPADTVTTGTEESDDEPGPSRRRRASRAPAPVPPITPPPRPAWAAAETGEEEERGGGRGWRSKLGLGKRRTGESGDESERAKDENRARKDALANESGALFAGVENPIKKAAKKQERVSMMSARSGASRFSLGGGIALPVNVQGQGQGQGQGSAPLGLSGGEGGGGEKQGGFVVHRKGGPQSPSPSFPLAPVAPIASGSGSRAHFPLRPISTSSRPTSGPPVTPPTVPILDETPSFRVKRMTRSTPTPIAPPLLPGSTKASPHGYTPGMMDKVAYPLPRRPRQAGDGGDASGESSADEGDQKRSFRVIRRAAPANATVGAGREGEGQQGTFSVKRPVAGPAAAGLDFSKPVGQPEGTISAGIYSWDNSRAR